MKHYVTVPNATVASTSLSTNISNTNSNNNNYNNNYNNTYESCVNYRSHDSNSSNCIDVKKCNCHCGCGKTVGTVACTTIIVDKVNDNIRNKHTDNNHTEDSHKYDNHLNHITTSTVDGRLAVACENCVESQTEDENCCCGSAAQTSATLLLADKNNNNKTEDTPSNATSTVAKNFSFNNNNRDCFSTFQQQQQFAFFPNATEKVMANTRRVIVLSIYASSLVLSIVLFLLAAVYCQVTGCSIVWAEKNRQYAQYFPICASCLIAFLSTCWLISNFRRVETSCMREYSFLEMPTAVFSSLLAGVCAVIEIHYNFDYSYLYWSEKWALAAADSVILVFLHAGLAFALT